MAARSLFRRSVTPATAITAAGKTLDLTDDKARAQEMRRRETWQDEAWGYYDALGEVREAARYYSDAISRLTLFVGVRPEPQADPTPIPLEGDADLGVSAMQAAVAAEALDRLRSPLGGPNEIMRRAALQMFVPGECYLCGREDEDGERWDIYSTDELVPSDTHTGRWKLLDAPSTSNAGGTDLPGGTTTVARIWRQHPRISTWPDSPIRSALGILDELLIHTKLMRAVALSRIAGPGVLFLPNSMRSRSPLGDDADPQTDGQAVSNDPVVSDIIQATAAAISDPASAAGQVPVIVFVDDELLKDGMIGKDKLIQWDRQIDETLAGQRAELRERFAVAIDLPAELLTGKSDMNHWSSWNVDREGYDMHFAPGADLLTMALTAVYLTPYMTKAGVQDPGRFVFGVDPSALIADGDAPENARQAHDRILISDEAARRGMGYSEDDKPDDEERERRETAKKPEPQETPAGPGNTDETEPPEPVVAAGALIGDELPGLCQELAVMDAGLLRDVQEKCNAAMRRALERANNRLATLAHDDGGTVRETIRGLPARGSLDIAPTLGPTIAHRLAGSTDLFAGAWGGVERDFYTRVERVTEEVIALAQARGELTFEEAAQAREQLREDRDRGWAVLLTALSALAVELLFAPDVEPGRGEFDGSLVSPGVARNALIAAGGGGGASAASMLTAQDIMDLWHQAGISFEGWVWQYGDPAARTHPFEPHRELNYARTGTVYPTIDDPRLSHMSSFPPGGRFHPGDHRGCGCSWSRAVARKTPAVTIPGEQEAAA